MIGEIEVDRPTLRAANARDIIPDLVGCGAQRRAVVTAE
jgi:hypothetical protein